MTEHPVSAGAPPRLLRLVASTPEHWLTQVAGEATALLADHAHCELRAAASAQGLIAKNPHDAGLVDALALVAVEELEHFARVARLVHERGGTIGPTLASPYAEALVRGFSSREGEVLLDRLLVAGLIEARSLERFVLLSRGLADETLRALYADLLASEAGHRALFARLANERYPAARVAERSAELARIEARAIEAAPPGPRMHSGWTGTR